MNKVLGQIEEFFSIGVLFLVNVSKKISLSVLGFSAKETIEREGNML